MVEVVNKEKILKAIKELREVNEKRNFEQSLDLTISLKGIDMKKQENRKRGILFLPKGRGKPANVAVILPKKYSSLVESKEVEVLYEEDLPNISKRDAKKFAKRNDFILACQESVPKIARYLGRYLGVRGKMPDPKYGMIIRDVEKELDKTVDKFRNYAVRYNMKDNPSITVLAGSESQSDEDLAENVFYLIDRITDILPDKKTNVKEIFLKFTMSKPVKLY